MNNNLIENRQIRVFISSTFQDMQDERDYLMKRTFPKLRKLAEERDVTLTELDLRWGITEEESKSGKVVEICLREIENSIPFFIGIIGNRYGWVPTREDLGGNVTERFADVNNYIDQHLSVTEMEMQFGVLEREEDMHAYFYIKEQEEKQDNPEMLQRLKDKVRKSKYPSYIYKSPEDLAVQVETAFMGLLDTLFPEGNLSELEKERIGQRSTMNQLCQSYVRDDNNFQILDNWLMDWNLFQLVVTGTSGLGKSALIANWIKEKLADSSRNYNIIYYFVGNRGSECDYGKILSTLILELRTLYGYCTDAGDRFEDKTSELDYLFQKVSRTGDRPLLVVIDAVNQIEDVDDAKEMSWLPIARKGIKMLFSTLESDRTMRSLCQFEANETLVLQPLDVEKRKVLISEYLGIFSKKLSDTQIERIALDKQCENTLVLRVLLDELINFGVFQNLDQKIDSYLHTDSVGQFYQIFLESVENEYGVELTKHFLSLVAVSNNGLSEEDIYGLLNMGCDLNAPRVSRVVLSQLNCSLCRHFCNRKGLISYSHTIILEAVKARYLQEEYYEICRREMMSYFENVFSYNATVEYVYNAMALHELDLLYKRVFQRESMKNLLEKNLLLMKKVVAVLREGDYFDSYSFFCVSFLGDEDYKNYVSSWIEEELSIDLKLLFVDVLHMFRLTALSNMILGKLENEALKKEEDNELIEICFRKILNSIIVSVIGEPEYNEYDQFDFGEVADKSVDYVAEDIECFLNMLEKFPSKKSALYAYRLIQRIDLECQSLLKINNAYPCDLSKITSQLNRIAEIALTKYAEIRDDDGRLGCLKYFAKMSLLDFDVQMRWLIEWANDVQSAFPIGGEERLECLRAIAFFIKNRCEYRESYEIKKLVLLKNELSMGFDDSILELGQEESPKNKNTFSKGIELLAQKCYESKGKLNMELQRMDDGATLVFKNIEIIPDSCCSNDTKLVKVVIPDSVVGIGEFAFANCSELLNVEISETVKYIGWRAFQCCSNLRKVSLSSSLTEIIDDLFDECGNLEYLEVPISVKKIGESAFSGCKSLHIVIPKTIEEITKGALTGVRSITLSFDTQDGMEKTIDMTLFPELTTLIVPDGCRSTYLQHPYYKRFKEIFEINDAEKKGLKFRLRCLTEDLRMLKRRLSIGQNEITFENETTFEIITDNAPVIIHDYDKVLVYQLQVLEASLSLYGDSCSEIAKCFNDLGCVYLKLKDYENAETCLKKALKIQMNNFGEEDLNVAIVESNLGYLFENKGEIKKAITHALRALKICENINNNKKELLVDFSLRVADLFFYLGDYHQSLDYYESALEYNKTSARFAVYPPMVWMNIGDVLFAMGDYCKSLEYYMNSLSAMRKSSLISDNDIHLMDLYYAIGRSYEMLCENTKAIDYYKWAVSVCYTHGLIEEADKIKATIQDLLNKQN